MAWCTQAVYWRISRAVRWKCLDAAIRDTTEIEGIHKMAGCTLSPKLRRLLVMVATLMMVRGPLKLRAILAVLNCSY